MIDRNKNKTQSNQTKTKPKKFIPLGARGYVDDELMEFIIKCHDCGSDWIIKRGFHQHNPALQMLECNDCGCRFDIEAWVKEEVLNAKGLPLMLPLSDLTNYSAKLMAKRLGMHPTTYAKYEHIVYGAIMEQLGEIALFLNIRY